MHARILTALALGLAGLALPAPASAQWATVATDTLAGTTASERSTRFSVAIDAADAPHALWSVGSRIYYSRKPAGAWLPPTELSQADANYAALALTIVPGTSRPCVLYTRTPFGAPAGELVLAEWNGSGFDLHALTADGVTKFGPALAIDAGGAYHVVCVVQSAGEWRLRYLTNVTGSPTDMLLAVGPLGAFGSGATPAIAVEPGGIAHVVYRGVSGGYRIHHAENSAPGGVGWSWQTLVSPNLEDTGSDVRIDAAGTVHVAASGSDCDVCMRRTHVFKRPAGGAWSVAAPIAHTNGLTGPSLAVDAEGQAHVAVSEISGSLFTGRILYASALTGWAPSLVIGNDHGTPSLAVGAQGKSYLVCTTGPNTGQRNVLCLQSQLTTAGVGDERPPAARTWRASPNPFRLATVVRTTGGSSMGSASGGNTAALVFDVAGRIVRHLAPTRGSGAAVEYAWDGRNDVGRVVPAGVYRIAATGGSGDVPAGTRAATVVKLP